MKSLNLILFILVTAINGLAQKSQVIKDSIYSENLDRHIRYNIYLPMAYDKQSSFPIVYLLHGHGGNEDDWIEAQEGNAQYLLDSLIDKGLIPNILAVTLDAQNTWYVDSKEKMQSAYLEEFIPLIENRYKVKSDRASRMIAGNSAGGFGSLGFALRFPELFHSVILLSPASYYPAPPPNSSSRKIPVFKKNNQLDTALWQSFAYPSLVSGISDINYPDFYISTGDDDEYQIVTVVTDLQKFFIKNEIEQELTIINGGHTWDVWRNRFCYDLVRIFQRRR